MEAKAAVERSSLASFLPFLVGVTIEVATEKAAHAFGYHAGLSGDGFQVAVRR